MIIIGITGTLGAGKGEVVSFLQKHGFEHFSARDFIVKEVENRNLPVNRDMTTLVANDLRAKFSPSYIIESLYKKAKEGGKNSVIESVRALAELEFLKKQKHFVLLAVDADPQVRYKRVQNRKSELDKISYEKFLFDEEREMYSEDKTKGNIAGCMKQADFLLMNNGSLEDLHAEISKILPKILKK